MDFWLEWSLLIFVLLGVIVTILFIGVACEGGLRYYRSYHSFDTKEHLHHLANFITQFFSNVLVTAMFLVSFVFAGFFVYGYCHPVELARFFLRLLPQTQTESLQYLILSGIIAFGLLAMGLYLYCHPGNTYPCYADIDESHRIKKPISQSFKRRRRR